jgi:hypothetical protein
MRFLRVIPACFLASAFLGQFLAYPHNHAKASEKPTSQTILYTQADSFNALAWLRGGERFRGARLVIQDVTGRHSLLPSFYATADADVSFEGTAIVFAGKEQAADPWQVYELTLSGGTPRRITSNTEDCIRPLYLPGERVIYAHKAHGRFVLESASLAGGKSSTLSFAAGNFLPNDVLRDGRILFTTGFPLGTEGPPELYTEYSDGSGVEANRCDHGHARFGGKQLSDGDIVFTRSKGLGRFTSPLAHEVDLMAPAGDYAGGIAQMPSGELLVSWRSGPAQPYVLKGWRRGGTAMTTVEAPGGGSVVQPVVVAPRPEPNRHPSGLHEWTYSNLLALNASISRDRVIDGKSIAAVRVVTLGDDGIPQILGTATVEKDGSFFVQVPGDRPLRFELLNAAGKVLEQQRGWMWARGGEQRICVGCHAGPERAPDNAVPAVLLRSSDPTILTGTVSPVDKGGR